MRPIALDCDVLIGGWPPRSDIDFSPDTVRKRLDKAGITSALVCSGRGAWFDDIDGNTETIEVAKSVPGFIPVGTINLRNALRAESELDRLLGEGVRHVRLFGVTQACEPHFPGYQHVIDEAVRREFTILTEGDVRQVWSAFAGRGATVIFLDAHAYHLADFILAARSEPGFIASTRLLNAPDSIERVIAEVGPQHLAFGSRTPLHEFSPATIRMRGAKIEDADWDTVTGAAKGNSR